MCCVNVYVCVRLCLLCAQLNAGKTIIGVVQHSIIFWHFWAKVSIACVQDIAVRLFLLQHHAAQAGCYV